MACARHIRWYVKGIFILLFSIEIQSFATTSLHRTANGRNYPNLTHLIELNGGEVEGFEEMVATVIDIGIGSSAAHHLDFIDLARKEAHIINDMIHAIDPNVVLDAVHRALPEDVVEHILNSATPRSRSLLRRALEDKDGRLHFTHTRYQADKKAPFQFLFSIVTPENEMGSGEYAISVDHDTALGVADEVVRKGFAAIAHYRRDNWSKRSFVNDRITVPQTHIATPASSSAFVDPRKARIQRQLKRARASQQLKQDGPVIPIRQLTDSQLRQARSPHQNHWGSRGRGGEKISGASTHGYMVQ